MDKTSWTFSKHLFTLDIILGKNADLKHENTNRKIVVLIRYKFIRKNCSLNSAKLRNYIFLYDLHSIQASSFHPRHIFYNFDRDFILYNVPTIVRWSKPWHLVKSLIWSVWGISLDNSIYSLSTMIKSFENDSFSEFGGGLVPAKLRLLPPRQQGKQGKNLWGRKLTKEKVYRKKTFCMGLILQRLVQLSEFIYEEKSNKLIEINIFSKRLALSSMADFTVPFFMLPLNF